MEWTSRMSAASTTMSVRPRRPASVSAVWMAPAARIDGTGRRSTDERGVADDEDLHARLRGRAPPRPPGLERAGQAAPLRPRPARSRRASGRASREPRRAADNPGRSATIGRSRRRVRGPRGGPPSSAGRRPSSTRRSMTTRSRSGSIAGLVTWAKAWRRWSAIGRSRRPRPAVGVSSPMLQSGSCASSAIVLMSSRARSASRPARYRPAWSSGGRCSTALAAASGVSSWSGPGLVVDREVAQGPGLRVGVLEDRPPAGLHQQQLAGPESAAADGLGRGERHGAGLRRHGHQPVAVHREGRRTKAVAVDERPDALAVAEDDRGRAVPRRQHPGGPATQGGDMRVRARVGGRAPRGSPRAGPA